MAPDQGSAWIIVKADSYECVLSVNSLRAFPNSHIANLVELEVQRNPVTPSIRLDCDPEVAKELVAIVRHGSSYVPPSDNPRLLQALQHQADFYLGIPVPGTRASSCNSLQEYLLIPSSTSNFQLLMYSSGVRGWAVAPGNSELDCGKVQHSYWLASTLHVADGSGTDVAFMLPNDERSEAVMAERHGMLLKSNLTWGTFTAPESHTCLAESSMVAAQGRLYLLGGRPQDGICNHWPAPPPFQVFDPHVNQWFDGPSPYPQSRYLFRHALVSNKAEAVLLSIGGWLTDALLAYRGIVNDDLLEAELTRPMTDQIALFDIRSSSWSINPSGCRFPSAAQAKRVSAAYVDDWTIMVVSSQQQQQQGSDQPSRRCAVDLLDLRTWRWRQAPDAPCDSGEWISEELHSLQYDGKVHLFCCGGRLSCFDAASNSWTELPHIPDILDEVNSNPIVMRLPQLLDVSS